MDVKNIIETSKKKAFQVYDFVNSGATDLNLVEKIILSSAIWFWYTRDGLGTGTEWIANNLGCSNAEVSKALNRLVSLGYIERTRKEGKNWDVYAVPLTTMENLTGKHQENND